MAARPPRAGPSAKVAGRGPSPSSEVIEPVMRYSMATFRVWSLPPAPARNLPKGLVSVPTEQHLKAHSSSQRHAAHYRRPQVTTRSSVTLRRLAAQRFVRLAALSNAMGDRFPRTCRREGGNGA